MHINNIKSTFFLFFAISISLLFASCGSDFLIMTKKNIPNATWLYRDTLTFDFAIEDTTHLYNLYMVVEHSTKYPNQNVYVKANTVFPDGKNMSQPVSFELADELGNWVGKCSSVSCNTEILLQSKAFFAKKGNYKLVLEQYMRQDSLQGISSMTFKLEDTQEVKK